MVSQKHLFELPEDIHYLNGAYMSPLMKAVQEAGIAGTKRKLSPWELTADDFFVPAETVKQKFGRLINAPAQQVAIIPSASYGLKSAISNIPANSGDHAIVVSNEFPSDYYTIQQWCKENSKELKIITAPDVLTGRGAAWNDRVLQTINTQTAAVVLSSVHWADGTKFNLQQIGEKCKAVNALFIVDGTQSVGALPIDIIAFKIDALVCAAYKWLMGPYSIGLAYYSENFNNGIPIEDSWMNKSNAHDFARLSSYVEDYKPGANRYNVGEFSNNILMPMLDKALDTVTQWGADAIQDYCVKLIGPLLHYLQENKYWIEAPAYRTNHLFGFLLPGTVDKAILLQELQRNKVFVSLRGDSIRVSPHVYNNESDIEALIQVLKNQHKL
jgi:selenocysteine lyase/cysteine desulfurase